MTTTTTAHLSFSRIWYHIAPHALAVCIFILLSCLYFLPQFQGKQIPQTDIMQFQAMVHETLTYQEETGKKTLWTNSMFSGMPNYQIHMWPDGNKISWLERALNFGIPRPAGYFIFAQLAFYIMLLLLGINRWVAIPAAIAFAFITNNIVLFEAGHTSKLRTLFSAPLVIAAVMMVFRQKLLKGGILFSAFLALSISTNHPQITYYLAIFLGVLTVIEGVRAAKGGTLQVFGKGLGVLAAGALIAIAAGGYALYATLEYSHETMRGKPTLAQTTTEVTSSSQTEGLAWDYAMAWSNGGRDLLAGIVARAAGGSSSEKLPDNSEWNNLLRRNGIAAQPAPLYFGALPFTSGPAYFGAILLFLFLFGAITVRGHLKWWLVSLVILTLILSMGRHMPTINRLFFDYFPLYNKFRAPSSILTVTSLLIPILAAMGLAEFFKGDKNNVQRLRTGLLWAFGITGGLTLLLAVAGTGIFSFSGAGDARYAQMPGVVEALEADRKSLFRADALRSFALIAGAMGLLWARQRQWIKSDQLAILGIAALMVIDLWGVGKRYISADDFVPDRQIERAFTPDAIDQEILRDPDMHFRVHDLTTDPFNNTQRAYFHKMIGGYHAAKLQRYQDIIEHYLSKQHLGVLNMLNAKYFIVPGEAGEPMLRHNPQANGNAWFIQGIHVVQDANAEIAELEYLDPRADVIIHKEFEHLVKGFQPSKNGSITLLEYAPDRLVYRSESQSDQLAVFSEVWYGPGKGWHAYIDGKPAELMRANYILRALNVPEGEHIIEMVFRPKRYYQLKTVSMIVSLAILAALVFLIYTSAMRFLKAAEAPVPAAGKKPTGKPKK